MKNEGIHRLYFFCDWYGENGYLHNFFPAPFRYGSFGRTGGVYASAEQFLMQQKASAMGAEETADAVMATLDPEEEKKLGRGIQNYDEELWSNIRFQTIRRGIRAKFQQNPQLIPNFLDTGTALLAEANPKDHLWGIGLGIDDPRRLDPENWDGENLLGKILAQVRSDLFGWLENRTPERIQYIDAEKILEYGEAAYFPPFCEMMEMPLSEAAEIPDVREIILPYAWIVSKQSPRKFDGPEGFLTYCSTGSGLSIAAVRSMLARGEAGWLPEAGFHEMVQDLYDMCRFGMIRKTE